VLLKHGIPLTKMAPDFLCRIFIRTAAGLRMLRMFAGSVADPVLIVSARRGVVCQDALEAALACIHKYLNSRSQFGKQNPAAPEACRRSGVWGNKAAFQAASANRRAR